MHILFKITIPLSYPGILKAALLVFLMSIADFGNPMLISGNVHFLATDAYLYWVGENNLEMAAVFCVFLIIPSMLMFIIHEFVLKGKSFTTIGGKPQQAEERDDARKNFLPHDGRCRAGIAADRGLFRHDLSGRLHQDSDDRQHLYPGAFQQPQRHPLAGDQREIRAFSRLHRAR